MVSAVRALEDRVRKLEKYLRTHVPPPPISKNPQVLSYGIGGRTGIGSWEDEVGDNYEATPLFQFLEDGSGMDAAKDFSVTPGEFKYAPATGERAVIHRMLVTVEDTTGFTAQEYGNLGAALTNGVKVETYSGNTLTLDLLDGFVVKTNAQWAAACYDADLKSWGAGDELLAVRWTFSRSGTPLLLEGDNSDELRVTLNDDFSGLIEHLFFAQGYLL